MSLGVWSVDPRQIGELDLGWWSFGGLLLGRRAGVFGGTPWGGSPSGPHGIPDIHIGFHLIIVGEFWRDSGEISGSCVASGEILDRIFGPLKKHVGC